MQIVSSNLENDAHLLLVQVTNVFTYSLQLLQRILRL